MKNQKIIIICLAVLTVIAVVLLIWHPWSPNDNVSTTTKETAGETTGILRDTETTGGLQKHPALSRLEFPAHALSGRIYRFSAHSR